MTHKNFKMPDSVTSLAKSEFADTIFHRFSFGKGLKSIDDQCFEDSNVLRFVSELPECLASIGDFAFAAADGSDAGMEPMRISLRLHNSLEKFGAFCFAENNYLAEILAGDEVWKKLLASPGSLSFTGIERVRVPSTCRIIAKQVCYHCEGITELDLPEGVEIVGEKAFACISVSSLSLPVSLSHIGDGAFSGMRNCKHLQASASQWPLLLKDHQISGIGLEEVRLPNTVESIGPSAFGECKSLRKIYIPESVTHCSLFAFDGCESLTDIYLFSRSVSQDAYPWDAPEGAVWHVRPRLIPILKELARGAGKNITFCALDEADDCLDVADCGDVSDYLFKSDELEVATYVGYELDSDSPYWNLDIDSPTAMMLIACMALQCKPAVRFAIYQGSRFIFPDFSRLNIIPRDVCSQPFDESFPPDWAARIMDGGDTAFFPVLKFNPKSRFLFLKRIMIGNLCAHLEVKGAFRQYKLQFLPTCANLDCGEYDAGGVFYDDKWYPLEFSHTPRQSEKYANEICVLKGGVLSTLPRQKVDLSGPWCISLDFV